MKLSYSNLKSVLFLLLTMTYSMQIFADELVEYGQSIRALGMGNAYTAVTDNYEALWYNPAALGRVEGINLTFLDLNAGFDGTGAMDLVKSVQSSTATGLDRLSPMFGKQIWVGLGTKEALTSPYFGVGVYDSGFAKIKLRNPTLPTFEVGYLNDLGFVIGTAFAVGPGAYFGVNGKKVIRTGNIGSYGVSNFLDGSTKNISADVNRKGNGYGADLGFVWRIPGPLNPTFSGVWKDIGTTTFIKENGYLAPPRIEDERILGFSTGFDLKIVDMTAAIDYKHINSNSENIGKKIHFGLELGLPLLDLRGGFSQGYYSMGATIDLYILKMDLAYYGVELGEYPGQHEDRRIEAQLIMEVGFDPSFKFLEINKYKGRKLKLRR